MISFINMATSHNNVQQNSTQCATMPCRLWECMNSYKSAQYSPSDSPLRSASPSFVRVPCHIAQHHNVESIVNLNAEKFENKLSNSANAIQYFDDWTISYLKALYPISLCSYLGLLSGNETLSNANCVAVDVAKPFTLILHKTKIIIVPLLCVISSNNTEFGEEDYSSMRDNTVCPQHYTQYEYVSFNSHSFECYI